MKKLNLQVNAIVAGVKAAIKKQKINTLTSKISAALEQKLAIKGKGTTIIEAIGKEISGNTYNDCKSSNEAAALLLKEFKRFFDFEISTGNHQFIYKSDELLLISIEAQFYEITSKDMKSSILEMAKNAGIPGVFIGVQLARLLIEGLIEVWKQYDSTYNEKANRLLE